MIKPTTALRPVSNPLLSTCGPWENTVLLKCHHLHCVALSFYNVFGWDRVRVSHVGQFNTDIGQEWTGINLHASIYCQSKPFLHLFNIFNEFNLLIFNVNFTVITYSKRYMPVV
jgi:hypothetical protein